MQGAVLAQCLVDGLLLGGLYTLMAIGLSLSFGVTRIINFAHGEAIMLGAYAAFWLASHYAIDPLIGLPLVLVAGFFGGYLFFRFVIQPVLNDPPINQILLTFGVGLVLQNAALMFLTGDRRSINPPYAFSSWEIEGVVISGARVIAFVAAVALVLALFFWLFRTELGRAARALAENTRAAALMGIRVNSVYAIAFGISIALGVATGAIFSFLLPISPFMGFSTLIKGFAIIILGGLGSIFGTVAGAMILGFAETFVAYFIPDGNGWAEGVAFAVLFCIMIVRPYGIAGRHAAH
jgi:branched-chain amino acid transport system permease protein